MKEFILQLNWFSQFLVIGTMCGLTITIMIFTVQALDDIRKEIMRRWRKKD